MNTNSRFKRFIKTLNHSREFKNGILCSLLFLGGSFLSHGQDLHNIDLNTPAIFPYDGSDKVLKNPERGLSFKSGYFDIFVDNYAYDGAVNYDFNTSNNLNFNSQTTGDNTTGVDIPKSIFTVESVDNGLYEISDTLHFDMGSDSLQNHLFDVNMPARSSGVSHGDILLSIEVFNASYNGQNYPKLTLTCWYNHNDIGRYLFSFNPNNGNYLSPGAGNYDANPIWSTSTGMRLVVGDNKISFKNWNTNHVVLEVPVGNISNTMDVVFKATKHTGEIALKHLNPNGTFSNYFENSGDEHLNITSDYDLTINTELSDTTFAIDLENPDTTIFSFDSLAHKAFFKQDFLTNLAKSNTCLVDFNSEESLFIEENGISMVELEQYVHFSEENIDNGEYAISDVTSATTAFNLLKSKGLKAHFVMNSDFAFSLGESEEGAGTRYTIPAMNKLNYLYNVMDETNTSLYSNVNHLIAVSHLGWLSGHNDLNYYRLSPTWLGAYSKYNPLYSNTNSNGGYLYESFLNNNNTLRNSSQRSSWKYHSAIGGIDGYTLVNNAPYGPNIITTDTLTYEQKSNLVAEVQLQDIKERVLDKIIGYFGNKKIILEETLPWDHKFTHPTIDNSIDGFDVSENVGFYDGAFATTYNHLVTISDDPQAGSHDFSNLNKRDLYVLGKHSENIWVHGDMPVYFNNTDFQNAFGFYQNIWQASPEGLNQFNYDAFEGMVKAHADEQNPIYAAKKIRMFNFTSFDITYNNSDDLGLNLYQKSDVPNGAGAIDKWKSTQLTETLATTHQLPFSSGYFDSSHTVFDYIRDHLGYRLELKSLETATVSSQLNVTATIQNRGFSAPKNKRSVYFVLMDSEGNHIQKRLVDTDWTTWKTDSSLDNRKSNLDETNYQDFTFESDLYTGAITYNNYELEASFNLDSLEIDSNYRVSLWIPDTDENLQTPDYAVKLANNTLVGLKGENVLGIFTYQGLPSTFATLSVSDSITEGNNISLEVELSDGSGNAMTNNTGSDLVLNIGATYQTANAYDINLPTSMSITILPNSSIGTLSIPTNDDTTAEYDEELSFNVISINHVDVSIDSSLQQVIIIDNDTGCLPALYTLLDNNGISQMGSDLKKSVSFGSGLATAKANVLLEEGDYITFTTVPGRNLAVKLRDVNSTGPKDRIHGIAFNNSPYQNTSFVYVLKHGNSINPYASIQLGSDEDVFKIAIEGRQVVFYRNNLRMFNKNSDIIQRGESFEVIFELNSAGAELNNVRIFDTCKTCSDKDGDSVCNDEDSCDWQDDLLDENENGIADGCETDCIPTPTVFSHSTNVVENDGTFTKISLTGTETIEADVLLEEGDYVTFRSIPGHFTSVMLEDVNSTPGNEIQYGYSMAPHNWTNNGFANIVDHNYQLNPWGHVQAGDATMLYKIAIEGRRIVFYKNGNRINYFGHIKYHGEQFKLVVKLKSSNSEIRDLRIFTNCNSCTDTDGDGVCNSEDTCEWFDDLNNECNSTCINENVTYTYSSNVSKTLNTFTKIGSSLETIETDVLLNIGDYLTFNTIPGRKIEVLLKDTISTNDENTNVSGLRFIPPWPNTFCHIYAIENNLAPGPWGGMGNSSSEDHVWKIYVDSTEIKYYRDNYLFNRVSTISDGAEAFKVEIKLLAGKFNEIRNFQIFSSCSGSTPALKQVEDPSDIEDSEVIDVSLYPNPATSQFMINTSGNIVILDVLGKVVYRGAYTERNPFSIEGYTPGLYVIQLTDKLGNIHLIKFIKE